MVVCVTTQRGHTSRRIQSILAKCLAWPAFIFRTLTFSSRHQADPEWSDMVKRIGNNKITPDNDGNMPLSILQGTTSISNAIDFVYPARIMYFPATIARRATLTGTHKMRSTTLIPPYWNDYHTSKDISQLG